MDVPQPVGDRRAHFVMSRTTCRPRGSQAPRSASRFCPARPGTRGPPEGLTCFVAHLGGRPSPAVQLDHASDIALVTPRAQEIGHLRVAQGRPMSGQTSFRSAPSWSLSSCDDCADPILFDFGPGSDAYFVYTRGRPMPKSSGDTRSSRPVAMAQSSPPTPPGSPPRNKAPSLARRRSSEDYGDFEGDPTNDQPDPAGRAGRGQQHARDAARWARPVRRRRSRRSRMSDPRPRQQRPAA